MSTVGLGISAAIEIIKLLYMAQMKVESELNLTLEEKARLHAEWEMEFEKNKADLIPDV